jgi:hypothetical protein
MERGVNFQQLQQPLKGDSFRGFLHHAPILTENTGVAIRQHQATAVAVMNVAKGRNCGQCGIHMAGGAPRSIRLYLYTIKGKIMRISRTFVFITHAHVWHGVAALTAESSNVQYTSTLRHVKGDERKFPGTCSCEMSRITLKRQSLTPVATPCLHAL